MQGGLAGGGAAAGATSGTASLSAGLVYELSWRAADEFRMAARQLGTELWHLNTEVWQLGTEVWQLDLIIDQSCMEMAVTFVYSYNVTVFLRLYIRYLV